MTEIAPSFPLLRRELELRREEMRCRKDMDPGHAHYILRLEEQVGVIAGQVAEDARAWRASKRRTGHGAAAPDAAPVDPPEAEGA